MRRFVIKAFKMVFDGPAQGQFEHEKKPNRENREERDKK
jgi:hypothetical protein